MTRLYDAADLRAAGYQPGAPSAEAAAIDGPIAESRICGKCGGAVQYRPWHRRTPYSYIALAVCTKCGHEEEL